VSGLCQALQWQIFSGIPDAVGSILHSKKLLSDFGYQKSRAMAVNPYRRSPTWDKITRLIEDRNKKMEEVRRLYVEVREIDRLISQLRAQFAPQAEHKAEHKRRRDLAS
jgi:hypothetical protein